VSRGRGSSGIRGRKLEVAHTKWLFSVTAGIVSTVVGGLMLAIGWERTVALGATAWAALAAVWTFRLAWPLWAVLLVLAGSCVATWLGAQRRYRPAPMRDTRTEILWSSLLWKVTAELRSFRATPAGMLTPEMLDSIVNGPYCPVPTCRRPRTASPLSTERRFTPLVEIQCP